jgi:hypothetical protein
MRLILLAALAATSLAASGQTTNFNQISHIETALNHLTVIDLGEPVANLAVAEPDAFEIERHDDKVFIKPIKEGISTNLFVWTQSRQLAYEVDPAGDVSKMNVVIRNAPPQALRAASVDEIERETNVVASRVLAQAFVGAEDLIRDGARSLPNVVQIELNQVYRSNSDIYLRYTIVNLSSEPFRITTPNVYQPMPTQLPVSVLSLRDHQISGKTFASFKAALGEPISLSGAQTKFQDVPPGQRSSGVISFHCTPNDRPQLYQLRFGSSQSGPITAETVL